MRELADDINENGLLHTMDLYFDYEEGTQMELDGRNRLDIDGMELLGWDRLTDRGELRLEYESQQAFKGDGTGSAHLAAWVISANIRRRHLNQVHKRDLLVKLLKAYSRQERSPIGEGGGCQQKHGRKCSDETGGRWSN